MENSESSHERQQITLTLPSERKTDVFDAEDFDAIKLINQIYPDETSLSDIDRFSGVLRRQIRSIDKEIYGAVRVQGGAHTRARDDVAAAHSQIEELFGKIKDIQRKAEESENMVQEICRDIKKMDYAKKHLTNTITALRRLAMLSKAVADLEQVSGRRDQYKTCANLLEAVHQLMEYFQQYESIPKVRNLSRRLDLIQSQLQSSVLDDFKLLMGQVDVKLSPENLDRLANACLVVDALGPRVRDMLMDWLCEREMSIYTAIFSLSGEGAKLHRFEHRFMWFRGRLEEKKEQWAIFPESWRVPQTLCLTFCKITKAQLKRTLNDDEAEVRANIGPLITAVVATNKFEKEMAILFGGAAGGLTDEVEEEAMGDVDNLSAGEVRRRLMRYRQKEREEAQRRALDKLTPEEKQAATEARTTFEGSISEAFEGVLRFYVAEEDRELSNHLETVLREEYENRWSPPDEEVGPKVLQSANKLFFKVRASINRCSKMISKGEALLALQQVCAKHLHTYAAALLHRLPKNAAGLTSASPPFVGQDWYIRVPPDEELVVCHILQTAEFCKETVEGAAAAVRKEIKAELKDKVDMSDLEAAFLNVASQCMGVLSLGINTRLDEGLQGMLRVRWDTIEQPGDDSGYVGTLRMVVLDSARRLGQELDPVTMSFFCDKMVRMFIPRFQEHLYRLKRISEKGTLQLSIDCDALKRSLLGVPLEAWPHNPNPDMPSYTNYIEREMGSVVNTVKVLQSKPENLVDTFLLLMPAGAQNLQQFTHLCEMKALTRKQQADLTALYQHRMSGGDMSSAPMVAPAAAAAAATAASLGAFKNNLNNITQTLASSISFSTQQLAMTARRPMGSATAATGETHDQALISRVSGLPPGHTHSGSAGVGGTSLSDAASAVKDRTKEGFSRVFKGLQSWGTEGQGAAGNA